MDIKPWCAKEERKNMNKLLGFIATLSILLASVSIHKENKMCNFLPYSDLQFPVDSGTGIDEATFKNVLKTFTAVYKPIAAEKGFKLQVINKWQDPTVNSNTDEVGRAWPINAYGGLARYNNMTADGYMLVLCHEIAHHVGGAPKYSDSDWATNEGQSDYFATMKCFREVVESGFHQQFDLSDVPPMVAKACAIQHKNVDDIKLCIRGSMAGYVLGNVLAALGGDRVAYFSTPDKTVVKSTNHSHPNGQCRLDTYFQGAICGVSKDIPFDAKNPNPGSCVQGQIKQGYRPNCWFAP